MACVKFGLASYRKFTECIEFENAIRKTREQEQLFQKFAISI